MLRNEASNKGKNKTKSYNSSSTNQPQTQASEKNKQHLWESHLATGDNTTKIAKKDKDMTKDLSHIEFYTCKQKGHYMNKYFEKAAN